MSDIWEDEFSAYNIDLLKPKTTTPSTAIEEVEASEDLPVQVPIQMEQLTEDEDASRVEEQQKTIENPFADRRSPVMALKTNDLLQMSAQLADEVTIVSKLRDQVHDMLSQQSHLRLPKGLRIIARNLSDVTHVLVATKALVDIYIEIGIERLYQTIKESKLQTTITNTLRMIKAHVPTLQEGLDDISSMMNENYDRPSANLRARVVKGQTNVLQTFAKEQAKVFVDVMDLFPIENGDLQLLSLMAEKDDEIMKQAVDNTMRFVGVPQVLVADAPVMLEAIKRNDTKIIGLLQKNMIEARMNT